MEIGEKSFTAAGSVITENIPDETLAFGRAKQINKEGWNKIKMIALSKEDKEKIKIFAGSSSKRISKKNSRVP